MELRVEPYKSPEAILFNYEELKQELIERCKVYETMVYTEEQIGAAKADRAHLNALKKALNDERIRRQKEYMKPFDSFKAQIDEIIKLIDKPAMLIDKQVKAFEDQQQMEKLEAIKALFAETAFPEFVSFEAIFNARMLNKSVSMKSIKGEFELRKQQVEADLATLQNLPEYAVEAVTEYKHTLDVNSALRAAQRASEVAKARAEIAEKQPEPVQEEITAVEEVTPPEIVEAPVVRQWVGFRAYLTADQARALKKFFDSNNIEFVPIK